jgi:hypothetical protein
VTSPPLGFTVAFSVAKHPVEGMLGSTRALVLLSAYRGVAYADRTHLKAVALLVLLESRVFATHVVAEHRRGVGVYAVGVAVDEVVGDESDEAL